ncbi:hypothetical protein F2Q68_00027939 [Brassica cretica]|uniref:Uncharacterized protein n=1 Tax=Brassica cretica TaxID=69181 RepID=A0A8S9IDT5_BRACR|nr:hypothetical protein F2Q68_00027939 [Brassica cretica]
MTLCVRSTSARLDLLTSSSSVSGRDPIAAAARLACSIANSLGLRSSALVCVSSDLVCNAFGVWHVMLVIVMINEKVRECIPPNCTVAPQWYMLKNMSGDYVDVMLLMAVFKAALLKSVSEQDWRSRKWLMVILPCDSKKPAWNHIMSDLTSAYANLVKSKIGLLKLRILRATS